MSILLLNYLNDTISNLKDYWTQLYNDFHKFSNTSKISITIWETRFFSTNFGHIEAQVRQV